MQGLPVHQNLTHRWVQHSYHVAEKYHLHESAHVPCCLLVLHHPRSIEMFAFAPAYIIPHPVLKTEAYLLLNACCCCMLLKRRRKKRLMQIFFEACNLFITIKDMVQ